MSELIQLSWPYWLAGVILAAAWLIGWAKW